MKKGIGPRNLGAPKGVGKMYDTKSAAKQATTSEKFIDLGSTWAGKNNLTVGEMEEVNRRVEKNYGKDPASIRSGYPAIDRRLDEKDKNQRLARARAGNKYYDGDGGGAARREKAYDDKLEERIYGQMVGERYNAYREKSKKGNLKKRS